MLTRSVPLHFSLSCFFLTATDAHPFAVTNVYAPCNVGSHPMFFAELASIAGQCACPWLVLGDFNIARAPEDKNNDRFDVASTTLFNDTIDALLLQELLLLDRRFTWSNLHDAPTLICLNCTFINVAWGATLYNSTLHSLPRPMSDHVLLLVTVSSSTLVSQVF